MIDSSEISPLMLKCEGALLRAFCQMASTKTQSCTVQLKLHFSLHRSEKRQKEPNSSALMFQHAADACCSVCSSAQTPNIEGDSLPPHSYLLVLVSLCSI